MTMLIRRARFPQDRNAVLDIWREYVASPSVSLDFQDNEAEFADLSGKYGPPEGAVLLAERDGRIEGCAAFRKVSDSICEMKRLYVRPSARGMSLGRKLTERLLAEAREAGYAEMRLDVLEEFKQARKLYADIGFTAAEPVSFNPLPGTEFLGMRLS
jgi:putative acetyltransferase